MQIPLMAVVIQANLGGSKAVPDHLPGRSSQLTAVSVNAVFHRAHG